jgi:hypothetical protein
LHFFHDRLTNGVTEEITNKIKLRSSSGWRMDYPTSPISETGF